MDIIEKWTLWKILDIIDKIGHCPQSWITRTIKTKVGQKLTKLDKMNKLNITDKIEESDKTVQIKYVETLENQEDLKNVM